MTLFTLLVLGLLVASPNVFAASKPNFVIMLMDDVSIALLLKVLMRVTLNQCLNFKQLIALSRWIQVLVREEETAIRPIFIVLGFVIPVIAGYR